MRLQVSLDRTDTQSALKFLEDVHDVVDIIEVGTPFIFKEGLRAVKSIRERYPQSTILADMKIMDGGEYAASLAYEAGADIVTVLAAADDNTIKGVLKAAGKFAKEVLADMIAISNLKDRAIRIYDMGADYIGVHIGFDVQSTGKKPIAQLREITSILRNVKAAVAGGIDLETLPEIVKENPAIIICGKSITRHESPRKAILEMKNIINEEQIRLKK